MPFTGTMSNNGQTGQTWSDPSGRGTWFVAEGDTPETSPWNPSNPAFAIPRGEQPFSAEFTGTPTNPNAPMPDFGAALSQPSNPNPLASAVAAPSRSLDQLGGPGTNTPAVMPPTAGINPVNQWTIDNSGNVLSGNPAAPMAPGSNDTSMRQAPKAALSDLVMSNSTGPIWNPPPPGQYQLQTIGVNGQTGGSNITFPDSQYQSLGDLVHSMTQNGVRIVSVQPYKFPWEPDSKISDAQRQFVGQFGDGSAPASAPPAAGSNPLAAAVSAGSPPAAGSNPQMNAPAVMPQSQPGMRPDNQWTIDNNGNIINGTPGPGSTGTDNPQTAVQPPSQNPLASAVSSNPQVNTPAVMPQQPNSGLPPADLMQSDKGNTPGRTGTLPFPGLASPNQFLAGGNGTNGTQTMDDYRRLVNSFPTELGGNLIKRPVVDDFGNVKSDPSLGNQSATAPELPKDLTDALRQLMQNALNQGEQGQEAYTGITNDIRNFLDFNRQATTDSMGKQDALLSQLMGRINPSLDQALSMMNKSEGLSPEAMAALRGQSMEGAANAYGQNVESLKTELARRGAAGGGELPGSAGDIARGYGPLIAAREADRSKGLRDTILADEQRKFESLGLNRQTAMQALSGAEGLTGTLGQIYDPTKFLGASQNALGGLKDIVDSRNSQANTALNTAGNFAGKLADIQPTSTATLLKNALLGSGFGALADLIGGGGSNNSSLIAELTKLIKGNGGGNSGDVSIPGGTGPAKIPGNTTGGGALAALGNFLPSVGIVAAPLFAALGVYELQNLLRESANDVADKWTPTQTAFGKDLSAVVDNPNIPASQKLSQVQEMWTKFQALADEFGNAASSKIEYMKQNGKRPDGSPLTQIDKQVIADYDGSGDQFKLIIRQMHQRLDPIMSKIIGDLGGTA